MPGRTEKPLRAATSAPATTRIYARPGFLLRRAHQISAAIFEASCAHLELTAAQFGALSLISGFPGLDQTRLARAMGFDKVTMLRVIKGLEARDLVLRRVANTSRRMLAIELTAAGRKLLQQAQAPSESAYQTLLEPLNAAEQKQLIKLLQKLTTAHEQRARAALEPLAGPDGGGLSKR